MTQPDHGRELDRAAYDALIANSPLAKSNQQSPTITPVAIQQQQAQDPYAGYKPYQGSEYSPNQLQQFGDYKPYQPQQKSAPYQPKYSAADIEAKVQEAAAAGVPENEIYGILEANASQAKDAQTRGILLQGGMRTAGGARDNFAGNITQAGQNNQTFTPTSAVGNIGDALAARGATEADYYGQLSNIERQKFDDERIERHRREERAREDALREEGYNREDFKYDRGVDRADYEYGRGLNKSEFDYARDVDREDQLRAEEYNRADFEREQDINRADYEYGRGIDRKDYEYDRGLNRKDYEYDRDITRQEDLISRGLTSTGSPIGGSGGSGAASKRTFNLEWRDPATGELQVRAGRKNSEGSFELQSDDGTWKPAFEVAGTSDIRVASRSADPGVEVGAGGIPNAVSFNEATGVPTFEFKRESEGKAYGYVTRALGANKRLTALEQQIDPEKIASLYGGLAQWAARNANAKVSSAVINNYLKDAGLQQYSREMTKFLQAILRNDTGAAYTGTEISDYLSAFGIAPGSVINADTLNGFQQGRKQEIGSQIGRTGAAGPYLNELLAGDRDIPFFEDTSEVSDDGGSGTTSAGIKWSIVGE